MYLYKILLSAMFVLSVLLSQKPQSTQQQKSIDADYVSYILADGHLRMYWKDDKGRILGSIKGLKSYVEQKKSHLIFAMNGGMYKKDRSPQGLYIQDKVRLSPLDTASGSGNFYLKPNGVFYITADSRAAICKTTSYTEKANMLYATQSGPMLIADGEINAAFKKGSEHVNIRNGVGILPDGKPVFAMSKDKVSFYDFAMFFKNKGCKEALYLDGFVSRTYLPAQGWEQTDGDFGVMIAVTDK